MSDRDLAGRRFLLVLLVASLVVVAFVARPIATALILAAVLTVVLAPLQERVAARLGGRRNAVAGLLVVAVLVVVVVPITLLSVVAVKEAADGVRFLRDIVSSEGVSGLVERLPEVVREPVSRLMDQAGDLGDLAQKGVSDQGSRAASVVGAAIMATGSFVFQAAMMLIALFFLLVQGRELVGWLDDALPLRPAQTRELLGEFKRLSYAIIVSTVVTAAVQAAAALAGYLIARVPHPLFFAGLTFFVALIPVIGAASVCLLAAAILLVTGHPFMAIFLAAWALVVVGLIDNVVKPWLIKDSSDMGGSVVFFALVGGIAAFGMVGLIVGPLAVAAFLSLVRMYRRDYLPAG